MVKWCIASSKDGRFTGVIPLGEGKGRLFDKCPELIQPELVGGKKPRCHFLVESVATIALLMKDNEEEKIREKNIAKHAFYCDLLGQASVYASYLSSIAQMLCDDAKLEEIRGELKKQKAKPGDMAVVIVEDINPLDREEWHDWWRAFRASLRPNKTTKEKMLSIVDGEWISPSKTFPKVKGLAGVGGLPTGDVPVGFDKEAFCSYGLEQSTNAAMSEETAKAYVESLNDLIRKKSKRLGNSLCAHWFSGEISDEEDPLAWAYEPPEQASAAAELKAREMLGAIRSGKRPDLAGSTYNALLLSGASGRVMMREFMQGSFETLVKSVEGWFSDLECVSRDGKGLARLPKFMAVAGALVMDLKDMPPPWLQRLWRSAITGIQIPDFILAQSVIRCRIDIIKDNPANHARMGLMKAYHIRKGDTSMQPYLNPDHPHPAYHCGRLLALYARLQRSALGDVGAGVVQRYYTAASQTPGLILGRLAANAKNHIGKLDGGLAYWYEDEIAKIWGRIKDTIPRTLTLEEQSLFALGYYQQLASRKGSTEKNNEKQNDMNKEENA